MRERYGAETFMLRCFLIFASDPPSGKYMLISKKAHQTS